MGTKAEDPVRRLGDTCSKIGSGATPRGGSRVYRERGVALIRSQNVELGRLNTEGLVFIGTEEAEKLSHVAVKPGDVLLNITGHSVARAARAPEGIQPARVNQHVAIIRPRPEEFDSRYLLYHFLRPSTQSLMLSLASSGGTRKALTKSMIERFEVPQPSIQEQRAIARILGALDDKIELNREINRTLEATAQAIFRSWFVDFDPVVAKADGRKPFGMSDDLAALFPDRFVESELGPIPEEWGVGELNSLFVLQRGFDLPKKKRNPGRYPVVAASGPSGLHGEKKVSGPGVVTGRSGKLGLVYFVDDDFWPLNTTLWVKKYVHSNPYHAFFLLDQLDLERLNAGSAVPTLNRNHVHALRELVPPSQVLKQFEETVAPLFTRRNGSLRESQTLAALRDLLLPKLLSGEIRVGEAEGAVEAAV